MCLHKRCTHGPNVNFMTSKLFLPNSRPFLGIKTATMNKLCCVCFSLKTNQKFLYSNIEQLKSLHVLQEDLSSRSQVVQVNAKIIK